MGISFRYISKYSTDREILEEVKKGLFAAGGQTLASVIARKGKVTQGAETQYLRIETHVGVKILLLSRI